jgi:pantetheine-phosphate adenylyltransferase
LQIVKKAALCFDRVIIGMGSNSEKPSKFDKGKMQEAIEETLRDEGLYNAEVVIYDILTVDKAREVGANILIRGLRNGTDYQYEENISAINEQVAGLDTCYFRAGELGYLSSSLVTEMYQFNKNIDGYVPKPVARLLENLKM